MNGDTYISCPLLENGLHISLKGIRHCCFSVEGDDLQPCTPLEECQNTNEFVSNLLEQKKLIINEINQGAKTFCVNCQYLAEGHWAPADKIKTMTYAIDQPCNILCKYCYKNECDYEFKNEVDIVDLIKKFNSCNFIDTEASINYACGEISIHPEMDEILNLIGGYNLKIYSNATRYHSKLLEIIKKPSNYMITALDCGTKDTYERIKKVDLFDDVCRNIEMYSLNGGNIILKYIFSNENSNKDDIDGFIDLCVKSQAYGIVISRDLWHADSMNSKIKDAVLQLRYKAIKNRIPTIEGNLTMFQQM